MYTLIIGRSTSVNFQKVVDMSLLLGGDFNGNTITLICKEETRAYETFFPLFRLNVLTWKRTRAYHNGNRVEPYRFMFLMDHKRRTFFAQVLEQLDDFNIFEAYNQTPFLYTKREGNRFYFTGESKQFDVELKGKILYDFVDRFNLGDIVYFE